MAATHKQVRLEAMMRLENEADKRNGEALTHPQTTMNDAEFLANAVYLLTYVTEWIYERRARGE